MKKGLTSNQLKVIAIAAMTLDHLTWTLFPGYDTRWFVLLAHMLGRVTAPVMWFFIAEGYHHTRSVKKYAMRLFRLAFLSHFAYNFCFGISLIPLRDSIFNQTGVIWSLAWGLVLLWLFDQETVSPWVKRGSIPLICLLTFPSDWSCIAAMAVLFIGCNRGNFRNQMLWMMLWTVVYSAVYFCYIDKTYAFVQLFTCLSIPLLKLYNGQRGRHRVFGKLFYFYYPAHLFLCGLLRCLLWGANAVTAAGQL